jgi:hypothetical protein
MSRPPIQSFSPTPDIDVYECHRDGERPYQHWRLWDKRADYNIVMSARTKEEALVRAIDYWAKKYLESEKELTALQNKVDSFVSAVRPLEDPEEVDMP